MANGGTRVIGILAMGSSRIYADWSVPEIWALNNGYRQVAEMKGHCEKIFLAHKQVIRQDDGSKIFDWNEMNALADAGIQIINTHRVKGLKASLFPMKRLNEKFFSDRSYYSDTVAYLLAYALDQMTTGKYKDGSLRLVAPLTLKLWGVDMMEMEEYGLEKGGIEFWLGYAMGLGVKVELTTWEQECNLLRTHNGRPYGAKEFVWKDIDPTGMFRLKTRKGHKEIVLKEK